MDIGEAIVIIIVFFLIIVPLTRWFYRIDEIADYLRRIADKLDPPIRQIILEKPPPPPPDPPKADCECCHKKVLADTLTEFKGKKVCPACKIFLIKK